MSKTTNEQLFNEGLNKIEIQSHDQEICRLRYVDKTVFVANPLVQS